MTNPQQPQYIRGTPQWYDYNFGWFPARLGAQRRREEAGRQARAQEKAAQWAAYWADRQQEWARVQREILEDSIRLLEGALPSEVARLNRRGHGRVGLAADRDGRVAATMFLWRPGIGDPCLLLYSLELTDVGWRLLDTSAISQEVILTARPRLKELGAPAVELRRGWAARHTGQVMPGESNWVCWVWLRAAAEVASLQVNERRVPVHNHGVAAAVWGTNRPPHITALDAGGSRLGPTVSPC